MAAACVFPLACTSCGEGGNITEQRPNVIYIFPDQMRNHAMGFWGRPEFAGAGIMPDPVQTPNLDRFAAQSAVLTSAMSNCPLSSPHRGMLLTGMFTENSGVPLNCNANRPVSSLREDAVCISDVFADAGYECAYIGKLHVDLPTPNDPANPGHYVEAAVPAWDAYTPPERRHGFGYWYSYGTYDVHKHPHYWDTDGVRHDIDCWSPEHEADKAIEWLRNENGARDDGKPFFMMVGFNPPHAPYRSTDDCQQEDYDLYSGMTSEELLVRPNADRTMKKAASAPYYFASVTGVDHAFGRIVDELERLGLRENTLVIFSSDHGETMCSHGVEDPKNSPYAESMNVPFIASMPGRITPHIDSGLILSTPDIMPTILGLCGLQERIPDSVEGRNYADRIADGCSAAAGLRSGALYIRNGDGERDADGKVVSYFPVARGIKTARYTMAITVDRKTRTVKNMLLFDDEADPYQMNPLTHAGNEDIVATLCAEMAQLLKEADDPWYKERILGDMIPYDSKTE